MSFGVSQAADQVTIKVYDATNAAVLNPATDTIFTLSDIDGTPINYQMWIGMENDVALGGMSLGFRIFSADGVSWVYDAQVDGLGPGGPNTGLAAVTVVPGCRMDPPDDIFDMTGLLITEKDVDGLVDDTIVFGGVSLFDSLLAGAQEEMIMVHFTPGGLAYEQVGTMCFDSAFVPPAANWVFTNTAGTTFPPAITQVCFTVKNPWFSDAEDEGQMIPYTFDLGQNYPNPFNPTTVIKYSIARKCEVNISIFNILGQKVKTLVDQEQEAGVYNEPWDGDDDYGNQVASGIYFYKMYTSDYVETRKMVLMR
jgi:hypothetical protein